MEIQAEYEKEYFCGTKSSIDMDQVRHPRLHAVDSFACRRDDFTLEYIVK